MGQTQDTLELIQAHQPSGPGNSPNVTSHNPDQVKKR